MSDFEPEKLRLSIARDLREIESLVLELHTQALNTPNARDFPGGTALHMLAPAASIAVWEAQYEATEEAERWDDGKDTWEGPIDPKSGLRTSNKRDPAVYQGDTEEQPLNVLESWTRIWREEFNQPTGLKATVSRELDYLRKIIDRVCEADEWGEPTHPAVFEMDKELHALVRRMENVLHFGTRPDLSKAKCTQCPAAPRLHKEWTSAAKTDIWRCPECGEPYDDSEAARALGLLLYAEGSEKFIWIEIARDVAGIDRRTWHSWRDRMKMREVCNIKTRKIEVYWPAVRELVSEHKERKKRLAAKRLAATS